MHRSSTSTRRSTRSRGPILALLAVAWVGLLLPAASSAEPTAYTLRNGDFLALDLTPGEEDVPWNVASDDILDGTAGSLAFDPDGNLWVTHHLWPLPDSLLRVDPSTGSVTFVGEVPSSLWTDLAFDAEGRLWMARGGELFEVDTGTAFPTPRPVGLAGLSAVAAFDGRLYGIDSPDPGEYRYVELFPETGTHEVISDLEGFVVGQSCYAESVGGMTFDDFGGLWVEVVEWNGTCIIPFPSSSIAYYPDPSTGEAEPRRRLAGEDRPFFPSLVLGNLFPTAVDVPAVDPRGLVAFALLLLVGAVMRLRARP